ncbi:MAG: LysR family transcriptional regulator, partial [Myxococcota bacterium]
LESLEQDLEVKLFERTPRGLLLTSDKERILSYAQDMEERAVSLARDAHGSVSEMAGEVRVSTIEAVASGIIASALPPLLERYPELEVILLAEWRTTSLSRRESDIALRLVRPNKQHLMCQRVATLTNGLYAAQSYLSTWGQPSSPRLSLAGHRLVTYDSRFDHIPEVAWLHLRAEEARMVTRANSILVIEEAVRAGVGIGVLPCVMAERWPDLESLVNSTHMPRRDIWLVLHEDSWAVPRIRTVAQWLADLLERSIGTPPPS